VKYSQTRAQYRPQSSTVRAKSEEAIARLILEKRVESQVDLNEGNR
jgi:hypothetical protein